MAWNPPAAFTNGAVLTAAQLNQIRDSLLETAVAKATTAGRFMVATGLNSVAERAISDATINASVSTTSASFVDLGGPSVTLTTDTSAMVHWAAQIDSATAGAVGYVSIEVPTSSVTASTNNAIIYTVSAAGNTARLSMSWHITGLTPGTNVFRLEYLSGGGQTVNFQRRHLWVFPH